MSVNRYFLDGFATDDAYRALGASDMFPLVRELQFKYGLKVVRYFTGQPGRPDACQMAFDNGLAVCKVWARKNASGQMEYFYRSPFFLKDRGESREDKETLHSTKLSSLMATITRRKVVPNIDDLMNRNTRLLRSAVELMKRSLGKSLKDSTFTQDEIHALLLMALGRSPNSDRVRVDQNKCQETLDKFEEADRVAKLKNEEVDRMFRNPFHMVGVDGRGDYLIGKFKLSGTEDGMMQWEVVEQFKRYRSYEQVPELIPLMTMVKVAYENKSYTRAGVLPIADTYDEGLDAVFFYNTSPGDHDCTWMVTSCT
jgi:hypothetical protein